jgi:tRNA modification GTPase
MAQAGEFTRTAFCNNKLDLAQAEAVSDLIKARSDKALIVAQKQLAGHLGEKINAQMNQLLEILAETEAYIDFPEEDLPEEDETGPISKIMNLIQDVSQLAETSHYGELLRDGIKTVIIGAPNAGKSSLLNHLLGDERAIVSPTAGTTRDFISERTMIGPYCMQLIDTAGLHKPGSEIEAIGIEKTIEKVRQGDFFLLIIEGQEQAPHLPERVQKCLTPQNTLLLINKTDLPGQQDHTNFIPNYPRLFISIKNGQGLEALRKNILDTLEKDRVIPSEHELIVSTRHATALNAVESCLKACLDQLKRGEPAELAASELRDALNHFGDILGKVDNEHMLDKLFSNFCIGK